MDILPLGAVYRALPRIIEQVLDATRGRRQVGDLSSEAMGEYISPCVRNEDLRPPGARITEPSAVSVARPPIATCELCNPSGGPPSLWLSMRGSPLMDQFGPQSVAVIP